MSQTPENVDLESEIEALIKRAGDTLRQPRDDAKHPVDQATQPSPSASAGDNIGGDG